MSFEGTDTQGTAFSGASHRKMREKGSRRKIKNPGNIESIL
jgi:hypothetical protein